MRIKNKFSFNFREISFVVIFAIVTFICAKSNLLAQALPPVTINWLKVFTPVTIIGGNQINGLIFEPALAIDSSEDLVIHGGQYSGQILGTALPNTNTPTRTDIAAHIMLGNANTGDHPGLDFAATHPLGQEMTKEIAIAPNGDIYIAGEFNTGTIASPFNANYLTAPSANLVNTTGAVQLGFVDKYTLTGGWAWTVQTFGTAGTVVTIDGADVNNNGDLFFGGTYSGQLTIGGFTLNSATFLGSPLQSIFVVKINSNGTVAWAVSHGGSSNNATAFDLKFDGSGNVVVVGDIQPFPSGPVTFIPVLPPLATFGSTDVLILMLTEVDGSAWYAKIFGSPGSDQATSVAIDLQGDIFVVGTYSGLLILNDPFFGTFASLPAVNNFNNIFALKIGGSTLFLNWAKGYGGLPTVFSYISNPEIDINSNGHPIIGMDISGGPINFGLAGPISAIGGTSSTDILFLELLSNNGDESWAQPIGAPGLTFSLAKIKTRQTNKILFLCNELGAYPSSVILGEVINNVGP